MIRCLKGLIPLQAETARPRYPRKMPFLLRDAPDFPGSRYAPELAKGALDMRFPPDLEAEYRRFYLTERRSHVRSFNVIMLTVITLGAAGSLLVPAAHGTGLDWVCLSTIAFCFGVLVWTAYGPRYELLASRRSRWPRGSTRGQLSSSDC